MHADNAIPERLSDWGVVFADGNRFVLNDGVMPYDLNTPLFSDYALKLRSVWMPAGKSAVYREDKELGFPIGTILSKTFHYEKAPGRDAKSLAVIKSDSEARLGENGELDLDRYVLIETRLLVRYSSGWKALPYVWNQDQDEAYLEVAGDVRNIELVGPDGNESAVYIVPDVNQCGGCHTPDHTSKTLRPLGPKAWQLNRPYDYAQTSANQLKHWAENGLLRDMPDVVPSGARWSMPEEATLEQRARAYLDINCAHCHNAAGAADTSALHLNLDAPLDRHFGLCKTPVAVGRGSGDRPYDIYPGRPDDSILLYRMQHTDPAIAMPELGRNTVHTEGVAVVMDWIASLSGTC